MLHALTLNKFKPFGAHTRVPMAPLTFIYGPNSSGKSSLIQSILLLKQTISGNRNRASGLIPQGDYVDLGSFVSLVHGHRRTSSVEIGLEFTEPERRLRNPSDYRRRTFFTAPEIYRLPRRVTLGFRQAKSITGRMDASQLRSVGYTLGDDIFKLNLTRDVHSRSVGDLIRGRTGNGVFRVADEDSKRAIAAQLAQEALQDAASGLGLMGESRFTAETFLLENPSDRWEDLHSSLRTTNTYIHHLAAIVAPPEKSKNGSSWAKGLEHLKSYISKTGYSSVPVGHVEEGFKIGLWATHQRLLLSRDRLTDDRKAILNSLPGWDWIEDENDGGHGREILGLELELARSNRDVLSRRKRLDALPLSEYLETEYEKDLKQSLVSWVDSDYSAPISVLRVIENNLAPQVDAERFLATELLPFDQSFIPNRIEGRRHRLPSGRFTSRMAQTVAIGFENALESVAYLGPLRDAPARQYTISGGRTVDVGIQGEYAPEVLYRDGGDIRRATNEWLAQFDIPYSIELNSIGDQLTGEMITMGVRDDKGLIVSPTDVGFGIGQLLPIVVQGVVANRSTGAVTCVEQPEIHLHPRMQANLADFFIGTSMPSPERPPDDHTDEAGVTHQWIVETHSEALMLRLQRRIREQKLSPDNVSVIYVDRVPGHTSSTVTRLRLDDQGEFIDEWPGGFFEEGFTEIFGGFE